MKLFLLATVAAFFVAEPTTHALAETDLLFCQANRAQQGEGLYISINYTDRSVSYWKPLSKRAENKTSPAQITTQRVSWVAQAPEGTYAFDRGEKLLTNTDAAGQMKDFACHLLRTE